MIYRNIIVLLLILPVHFSNAQSEYFYHRCDELCPIRSHGYGLEVDSTGFYLLYSDKTDTNQWVPESNIARYDNYGVLQWTQNYLSSANGCVPVSKLLMTADSHFVFCGITSDTPQRSFYVKTDLNGNPIFIKNYGLAHRYYLDCVVEMTDSNLMFVGTTDSLNSTGLYDLFILKTDPMGNYIWDTVITMNSYLLEGAGEIARINNKTYIATYRTKTTTSTTFSWARLIGINDDGHVFVNKTISPGSLGGGFLSIEATSKSTLMIGGVSEDYYWPLDGSTFQDNGYGRVYIGEYDTLGNNIWEKKYFIPNFVQRTSEIIEIPDGYLVCGGTGWDWFYWEDSLYSAPGNSIEDVFIMKIDENGDSLWMRLFRKQDGAQGYPTSWAGQDIVREVELSPNGDIYLAGHFFAIQAISGEWKQYAWVMKTDSNGCGKPGTPYGLWREELPYNQDSSIVHLTWLDDDTTNIWHHVQGSKDGQYYFWELTPRPVTNKEFFDTVPKYHTYCYRVFGLDSTWARTCESAEICITTGIEEYGPETGLLRVYPNPATDIINCVLPDNEDYEIVVYDALGSNASGVSLRLRSVTASDRVVSMDVSALPPGIYFIDARGEMILRGRFVKE